MAWLTRLSWLLGGKDIEATIVIVGLNGSGKSTVMRQLKPHEVDMVPLAPTLPVAFHAEKFSYKTFEFIAFGLGEQDGFGNPWEDFYKGCHGIVFVIDSSDRLALPSARSQLEKLLNHPNVIRRNIPLLFLANKTDVPSAMPPLQVADIMQVNKIKGKPCNTVGTDALTGEGFDEALNWLAHQLRRTRQLRWSLSLEYEQHA